MSPLVREITDKIRLILAIVILLLIEILVAWVLFGMRGVYISLATIITVPIYLWVTNWEQRAFPFSNKKGSDENLEKNAVSESSNHSSP